MFHIQARGTVYKFDSTMSSPGVIFSSGHNVPEGISYDHVHRILLVPNMFGNTIDFFIHER